MLYLEDRQKTSPKGTGFCFFFWIFVLVGNWDTCFFTLRDIHLFTLSVKWLRRDHIDLTHIDLGRNIFQLLINLERCRLCVLLSERQRIC